MHGRTLKKVLANEWTWVAIYLSIVVIATEICVVRRCNNFLIFRAAFDHLLAGRDMYALYPGEHADLYKYSPTFALLFAPFARLPFGIALLAWNLCNVMLIFQAIRLALPPGQRMPAIQLAGFGLIMTVDGTQSNGLIAALIIFAFVALERGRLLPAAFAIAVGTLVKLFPIAAAAFALPRRDRIRFAAIGLATGALLVAAPLAFTSPATLVAQYRSWYAMGSADALDRGASVMRLLHITSGYDGPNWPIQLAGTLLLLLSLLLQRTRWNEPEFRRSFLASLLVYAVIFNHKAEQPSFVIAVVGVAIWFAVSPRSMARDVATAAALLSTVPVLVAVAAPGLISASVDGPLLGAAACFSVAWFAMQADLLDLLPERTSAANTEFAAITDEPAV